MYINLESIKINTSGDDNQFVRISMVNKQMINLANETNKDYYKSPTHYIITRYELPLIIECLNGKSNFYPFFDDGIHKLQFHNQGITALEISPPKGEYQYFTFPGKWLSSFIELINDNPKESFEFDLTNEIYHLKCKYSPKIKFYFGDYGDYPYTIKESLKRNLNLPRFVNGLKSLVRIAKNHSNGDYVTINLYFDSYPKESIPDSYYWSIETDKKQKIMNGGLIFHPKYFDNKPDYTMGEYSIHT